jgi:peptide-methionine (S)-S-oxide reductase
MPVRDTHAVLGTPLRAPWPEGMDTLIVGMGCFWGAERLFWQLPGVYTTAVGYSGGHTPNPTYEETCTSMTGHTEAVLVVFDPDQVSLDDLLAVFWENHDPTQYMGQGNDIGSQYRSAIYTNSDEQLAAAEASRDRYQANLDQAGYGTIDHNRGRPGGRVLLRRELPPAVPGREPPRLLQPRLLPGRLRLTRPE